MLPGAAKIMPEIEPICADGPGRKLRFERRQQLPGCCRSHLVLYDDVRLKALGILRSQLRLKRMHQIFVQPVQGRGAQTISNSLAERAKARHLY